MPIFCSKCGKSNKDSAKFCCGCGRGLITPSFPAGSLTPGTLFEKRYKITALIKTGGMGAVYKAIDTKFDNICAVKEFIPLFVTPQEQQQAVEWFNREAKILNKLEHPNLPKVSDYFVNNNRYYLVMNFIEGEDLETILSKEGNPGLPVDKVIEWSKEVLQVLHYLHNQNPPIIYRDIKPGNIMIRKDGRVILIDFGIARAVNQDSRTKKTAIGTSGYAPAEQFRGNAEPVSDIYALGATMHHLITGIEPLPFKFEPLHKIIPSIEANLENIVMKALMNKVDERFSSAKDMLEKLNNLMDKSFSRQPLREVQKQPQVNRMEIEPAKSSPIEVQKSIQQVEKQPPANRMEIRPVKPVIVEVKKTFVKPEMILIRGGTFMMGSEYHSLDEKPPHEVTVCDFYMGKYPVTNNEYERFKPGHRYFSAPDCPVVNVSWYDAVEYCNWLSDKEGFDRCYGRVGNNMMSDISKNGYRLPAEAEWEYACRAGSDGEYYWGYEMDDDYCWYSNNSNGVVHSVGQKKPNAFGLYDMSGNIWEWCYDWYGDYPSCSVNNPAGAKSGTYRVIRGGCFHEDANECRSAYRIYFTPSLNYGDLGFRLVRV